ncbi:glycosyltransferase family 2 protein [Calditerricola yamamurae]
MTRVRVSAVIPAYNEAATLPETLDALRRAGCVDEVIVVDDGSTDGTADAARPYADRVLVHGENRGKGAALETGWRAAHGEILLFLDGDLGETAAYAPALLDPVQRDMADVVVAVFPPARRKGGFGLVKGLARFGVEHLTGYALQAPLSGQRAVRRVVLESLPPLSGGFGVEVGLTVDVLRAGFRLYEVQVPFRHRETGRDVRGFLHRGRQFIDIALTLRRKRREGRRVP